VRALLQVPAIFLVAGEMGSWCHRLRSSQRCPRNGKQVIVSNTPLCMHGKALTRLIFNHL
jgi:hypothetical protein